MQMKKTYPVDMQTDDEWRENKHIIQNSMQICKGIWKQLQS